MVQGIKSLSNNRPESVDRTVSVMASDVLAPCVVMASLGQYEH